MKDWRVIKNINSANKRRRVAQGNEEAGPSRQIEERAQRALDHDYAMADDPNGNDGNSTTMQPTPDASAGNTGGASSSSNGGSMRGTTELPVGIMPQSGSYTRTFSKQYQIRIFNQLLEQRTTNLNGALNLEVRSNHHHIPVQYLGFFLNQLEFQRLKKHTRAVIKHCKAVVSTRTLELPFNTNSGQTTVGNNNVGGLCQILDPWLHKKLNFTLEVDPPETIKNVFTGIPTWELPSNDQWSTNLNNMGAQYIRRNYKNRIATRAISTATQNFTFGSALIRGQRHQVQPINMFVRKSFNCSFEEGVMWEWEHTPKNGLIVENSNYFGNNFPAVTATLHGKRQNLPTFRQKPAAFGSESSVNHPIGTNIFAERAQTNNLHSDVHMNMAKDQFLEMLIDNEFSGQQKFGSIPGLYIGMEPLVGIENSTANPALVAAHMDITIDTSITIEITDGTNYDQGLYELFAEHDHKNPSYRQYAATETGQLLALNEEYVYVANRNGWAAAATGGVDVQLRPDMTWVTPVGTELHESGYTHDDIKSFLASYAKVSKVTHSARNCHPEYAQFLRGEEFTKNYKNYVAPRVTRDTQDEEPDEVVTDEEIEETTPPVKKPKTNIPLLSKFNL